MLLHRRGVGIKAEGVVSQWLFLANFGAVRGHIDLFRSMHRHGLIDDGVLLRLLVA